jgi:lipopolysaccharide/colanic/teichoic acid biosynthesis glycosyltransferase
MTIENGIHLKNSQKPISNVLKKYNVCPWRVFRIILERERSIFDYGDEEYKKIITILVSALKERARSIDQYGEYSINQIGVLLPNTAYDGADKFVYDICKVLIAKKMKPPGYKIYTYPSHWIPKPPDTDIQTESKSKKIEQYIEDAPHVFKKKMPKWKRIEDIVGAIAAIILSIPIFILVSIVIKLVSRGPVFFRQERVGYGGRIFTVLKFRTMVANTNTSVHENYFSDLIKNEKPMVKLDRKDDKRIIIGGKFFRKASIDEIPQFINVLMGDMSLVGPRPCLPNEAQEYLKWHQYRFDSKPGITGLWQVSGKNRLSFKDMIRLDIQYAQKISLGIDLWILFKTIPTVIRLTIEKFKIDSFFNKIQERSIPDEQFKKFIRRYYSDIYNVDKLEFIDDKLKNYQVDLRDLMLLLSKLHKLTPTYNVAKRYFGICKLIDTEKKSQHRAVKHRSES